MPYVVTATRGPTAMSSSSGSAVSAIEWIRRRRAVGADHFVIVFRGRREIEETDLANLAKLE